jgi:hypothetical protein
VEALGKRQSAANGSSQAGPSACGAARATRGNRPRKLLAPYKQEVARSSRAPPIVAGLLPNRNLGGRSSELRPLCTCIRRAGRRGGGEPVTSTNRSPEELVQAVHNSRRDCGHPASAKTATSAAASHGK